MISSVVQRISPKVPSSDTPFSPSPPPIKNLPAYSILSPAIDGGMATRYPFARALHTISFVRSESCMCAIRQTKGEDLLQVIFTYISLTALPILYPAISKSQSQSQSPHSQPGTPKSQVK
ncbi:hypothetical protein ACMFMF_002145 [Clarireedia jacksonii]